LQSHPELPWLYLLRGFASGQSGAAAPTPDAAAAHFEAALADYRELAARDPAGRFRYALLANRGVVLFQAGRLADAAADLNEAISLGPRQPSAYVALAQLERREHKLEPALKHLGEAIAVNPNLAGLYRMRARWRMESRDLTAAMRAGALADLNEAIKRDAPGSKDLAEDYAERGRLMILDKQFEPAVEACELALRISPDETEAHRWRAVALLELRRYEAALEACNEYLKAGHRSAELIVLRGMAKAKRSDFAGAIDDYTVAIELEPGNSALHARRGWAYLVSGAYPLARRDFEEAVRVDPSSADAYSGRGSAAVAVGNYREAVADAEESLRRAGSDPRIVYTAARTLAQAAQSASKEQQLRGRRDVALVRGYQDRAGNLLALAIEQTDLAERAAFWRDVVQTDPGVAALRRLAGYARLVALYGSERRQPSKTGEELP
jgi:tetratricopeptide (TPR) repeat protein